MARFYTSFFVLGFVLFTSSLFAQHNHTEPCLTDVIHERRLAEDESYAKQYYNTVDLFYQAAKKRMEQRANEAPGGGGETPPSGTGPAQYTVPIVVHVFHSGEPVGHQNNPSLAMVEQAIQWVNDGFRNNNYFDQGLGVDVGIEFCLAKRDPNDQPTDGIVRINNPDFACLQSDTEDPAIRQASSWSDCDYINLWLVTTICDGDPSCNSCSGGGVAGYANLPFGNSCGSTTNPNGMVVISSSFNTVQRSTITIHELGHYFGLRHVFQGGCQNDDCLLDGDGMCDTPPDNDQAVTNHSCTPQNTCNTDVNSGFATDQNDNIENFLDYSSTNCYVMFTQDQKDRMIDALTINRDYLLASDGCNPLSPNDAKITEIIVPTENFASCEDSIAVQAELFNRGTDPLTSARIELLYDGVLQQTMNWTGNLGQNEEEIITFDNISFTNGSHDFEVIVSDANGAGPDAFPDDDTARLTSILTFFEPLDDFCEDLEAQVAIPSTWQTDGNADSYDWVIQSGQACHGVSLFLDAQGANNDNREPHGTFEEFVIPLVSLNNKVDPNLTFDISHEHMGGFANLRLEVLVSNDCGATYVPLYDKQGQAELETVPNDGFGSNEPPFMPANCDEWRTETIDLCDYENEDVFVKFKASIVGGAPGNPSLQYFTGNLYIDNICVNSTEAVCPDFAGNLVSNDPACPNTFVDLTAAESGFNDQNNTTGTFTWYTAHPDSGGTVIADPTFVRLDTTNNWYTIKSVDFTSCGTNQTCSDTAFFAITVTEVAEPNIGNDTQVCVGSSFTLTTGNSYDSYMWSNGNTSASTTVVVNSDTSFSVTVSTAEGCERFDTINYTVFPAIPDGFAGPDTGYCPGEDVVLDAGAGYANYFWSPTNENTQQITVSTAGDYSVFVTDANGCSKQDAVTVEEYPAANLNLGNDTATCGDSLRVGPVIEYASYMWSTTETTQSINIIASGNYSLTVTNNEGCVASDDINVTLNPSPVVELGDDTTQCGGEIVLDAGPDGGGTTPYQWSTTSTGQTITVSGSGTYCVTVTGANGCETVDCIDVTILAVPEVDLGPDTSQCGGTITLNAGGEGEVYLWNTGETTQLITVDSTNSYSVEVTGANGCVGRDTIEVEIVKPFEVNLGPDTTQCEGTITLDAGNPGLTFEWSTTETTQTIDVSVTGTYSVTVTDVNDCEISDEIEVTIHTNPTVALQNDTAVCADTFIIIPELNGSTFVSGLWSTGATTPTLEVTASGNYTFQFTDENGCTSNTDDVNLTLNPLPTVDAGNDTATCESPVTLNADAPTAISFEWNNGAITQSQIVDSSFNYIVTVTDVNGCENSDDIIVVINDNPDVQLGNDTAICGGPYILDAGFPGSTYEWAAGETTQTIIVENTGVYSVTVTDANGCVGVDEIDITINPLPEFSLGNDTTTCSEPVVLEGPVELASYLWKSGTGDSLTNTQTYTAMSSGTYCLEVTDDNGCTFEDCINVTVSENPELTPFDDVNVCVDGNASPQRIGTPYGPSFDYQWQPNNELTPTIDVTVSGTYIQEVINGDGCSSFDTIVVEINQNPVMDLPFDTFNCETSLTIDSRVDNVSYEWSTGDTTRAITVTSSGFYNLTVTSPAGCSVTDAVQISTNTMFQIDSISFTQETCNNARDGEAEVFASGGRERFGGGYFYNWSTGAPTKSVSGLAAGDVTVTVTDFNGCSAVLTGTLPTKQFFFVDSDPETKIDPICQEDSTGYTELFIEGNTGRVSILWEDGDTNHFRANEPAGTVSGVATDENGCTSSFFVRFTPTNPEIFINFPYMEPISCAGGNDGALSAEITGGTGSILDLGWSKDGDPIGIRDTITNLGAGIYTKFVIDSAGCTANGSIEIFDPEPIEITSSAEHPNCFNLDIGVANARVEGGVAPYGWLWSNGTADNSGSDVSSISGLSAGVYTVVLTDALGCADSLDVAVVLDSVVDISYGPSTSDICVGEEITISLNGQHNFEVENIVWNPTRFVINDLGDQLVVKPFSEIEYDVRVEYENGCYGTDIVKVNIDEDLCPSVVIYDAITPNNDGSNDAWVIDNIEAYPNAEVRIYTRWQQLVFSSSAGYDTPWDGTYQGKQLPGGTYFYTVELNDESNTTFSGNLSIIY